VNAGRLEIARSLTLATFFYFARRAVLWNRSPALKDLQEIIRD